MAILLNRNAIFSISIVSCVPVIWKKMMQEEKMILKKFANSFINEVLPCIKKHNIELTKQFQLDTYEEIAYLFNCKYYGILNATAYRDAIEHVILQDVQDIVNWLCDNDMFICLSEDDVNDACVDVISKFQKQVKQYEDGNANVLNFLVGQVMKAGKGKFRADAVKYKFKELLSYDKIDS